MILPIIVAIVLLLLVVLGMILHPVRTAVRVASRILFIFILIIAVLGVFIVKDARDFRDALSKGDVLVLLEKEGSRVTGFALHSMNTNYFNDNEMKSASISTYDQTIIVSWDALNETSFDSLQIVNGSDLKMEAVIRILDASEDRSAIVQELAQETGIPADLITKTVMENYRPGEVKSKLFWATFISMYSKNDLLIVSHVKRGIVDIKPNGMLTWAIEVTPAPWLKSASKVIVK